MQLILTGDSAMKQDPSVHTASNARSSANTAQRRPISGRLMSLLAVVLESANSLAVSVSMPMKMLRSSF